MRTYLLIIGTVFSVLAALILSSAILLQNRPVKEEIMMVRGDRMIWWLYLTYEPNASWARIHLRMDHMGQWAQVMYKLEASEEWLPRWEGQVEGKGAMDDSPTLEFLVRTPEPMHVDVARRIVRSITVTLVTEGRERMRVRFGQHPEDYVKPLPEPLAGPRELAERMWNWWVGSYFVPDQRIVN
jgi:hypothetical protein